MPAQGRTHLKKSGHPTTNPALERLIMVVAVGEPLLTIPQIYQIWSTKNAQGVSLTTWALYILASAVWFFYGLKTHNKPLTVTGLLWVIVQIPVLIGILLWR